MSKLIGLRVLLFFRATSVVSLSLCDSSTYLEVKEGQNNTFVCTGLTAQPNVYFYWETSILLSTCTITSCSNDEYPEYFQFSRTEAISSKVTVYASTFPDLDSLAKTSLSCQQGSAANRVTCQLDVVYPAEDPKCQIQFSGDTWQVTGWCTVSRARSRRNRYGCYLYQTSQQSSSALVANVTMSMRPTAGTVYCQINTALPPEGKYNYSVIIIPGGVEVFPTFHGSNEIRRPSVSPQHNCSQTVTEGEDVNCVCFSDDLGLPSGYVMWTRTNSSKLKIEKVNRTFDGASNVCVLMWNNTAVQSVAYTIAMNYASRVLSFKIDNKADDIVNVRENTNVSVVCQAEGRPLPTLRLFTRSSDNQDVELTAANNELELQYTMSAVKCETSASYSCKSENEFSKDQRRILLIVSCAPRQTTQDIYSTAFNGVEARLEFKIIAYPPPDDLSVFYIGSSLNDTTLRKVEYKNTVRFECTSESVYMVTCTVTLLNETIFSTGVYHAVFSNALGDISLAFVIKEQLHTTEQSKPEVAGQVAGGVVGAVVAIVLTASIVIFVIRRKRMRNERGSRTTNPVMTSTPDTQKSLETLYSQLQREDVNSPSVYQSLGHQQTSSNFTNQVDSQSLCDASTYLEVKEGRDNTFVCTELTAQLNVYWWWRSQPLSTCDTTSCSNDRFPQLFQISRPSPTSSDIAVYVTAFPDLDFLATTNLSCQQTSTVTCQLDVVYPAEDIKCHIQFSGDTWEVTGWCTVSKALSRRNRYGCVVYQEPFLLVGNFTMSVRTIAGTNYVSGDCQIKIALPPEGKYNYSVIIIPGEVLVFPSFNGSNEIRRPSRSPQHNCPQYVIEGEDIDCLCFSDDLGLPSGSLVWRGADSSRLKIDKVNRSYSGTSNTCILMWSNTVVQSTQYTVTVNYASRVLSFKIADKEDGVVNVTENTMVSFVCRAEGRPLPTISLFRKGKDNLNQNIFVANNVSELQSTINVVNCEAAYNYFCKAENSISADQRNILLIVFCSPKKTMNDTYFTTFVDGEASLTFKMNAYPPPKLLGVVYNGSANNFISSKSEYENSVRSSCSSDTPYSSMITCTVTLLNQTIYTPGLYTVTFSNGLGDISFAFEIKEKLLPTTNAMETTGQSMSEVAGPVAGGVIGALVVIALVVSAVIFIRRKRRKPYERGLPRNQALTSKTYPERSLEIYDQLQRENINSPSVYQTLGPQQASSDFTDHEDQENPHVYDVPIDLHENTRGTQQKETVYQNSIFS